MRRLTLAVAAVLLLLSFDLLAQTMESTRNLYTQPFSPGLVAQPTPPVQSRRMRALSELRSEGLKMREADGGTLTPEHAASLQSKLDRIQQAPN
jgi:hypothetical protein